MAIPPQPFPLAVTIAQIKEDRNMGHFWSALGVVPRPTFALTVTVATVPPGPVEEYPAVKEGGIGIEYMSLTDPVLVGRVLNSALAPVAGAAVSVVEADRQTTSDPTGGYRFEGLAFSGYTLRVRAQNHPEASKEIEYQADRQIHNVILKDH
jgi:hypothetical protein